MELLERLKREVLILDGSMGALLQNRGLPSGYAPDLWNVERPDAILAVHAEYVRAGADILLTNTFGSSELRLAEYDAGTRVRELNEAAVALARRAAAAGASAGSGGGVYVAGDIGPSGTTVKPFGDIEFDRAYEIFREQADALVAAGVDLIAIETMFDLIEMKAALMAARDAAGGRIPVLALMTFTQDGLTDTGTDPETAATVLQGLGASIVGMNCSVGPEAMLPVIEKMGRATGLPIAIEPNAGLPVNRGGVTVFPMTAAEVAAYAERFVASGANIVGGCCGTTPEYTALLAKIVKGRPPVPRSDPAGVRITSRSKTLAIGSGHPFVIIGEKINPTGRKKFAEAIREGRTDLIVAEARKQFEHGAQALDVNVGVPLTDEPGMMGKAVVAIQNVVNLPLVIDSSDNAALEAGLRVYPGRALVNSVNAEEEKLEAILPLVKKHGAAVLALCAEDEIAVDASERIRAAKRILDRALALGMRREDIVFDPLALVVSAMQEGARQTLVTIRRVKEELGCPTSFGLSNVSFGLPNRKWVHQTFLAQAIGVGLDAAICSPYEEEMRTVIGASQLFSGRDPDCRAYINLAMELENAKNAPEPPKGPMDLRGKIYHAVLEGDRDGIIPLVNEAVAAKEDPLALFVDVMTPAIRELGDLFGARKKFIPHLVASADAMKRGVEILRPLIEASGSMEKKATIVMATVKGDIHDIGKSICCVMLRNFGFEVIDLGRNVPHETILDAAAEHRAQIVGLSALMTTTMMQMKTVVDVVRERNLPYKVMVGGAVLTRAFAREIGAHAYGKDVGDVVATAESLLGSGQGNLQ